MEQPEINTSDYSNKPQIVNSTKKTWESPNIQSWEVKNQLNLKIGGVLADGTLFS
ncbi:hypothetical protein G9H61_04125 [Aquirufa ecclesiirivi]|uniref:Uncharacterized protein n=1 Tax=Aquirufa ecclesiirivi TaxID=2715124 RepID=A0ABT4JEA8_9BACT|nr:hypothetical protein [Aquirufa ecclesiirivi]MCZ2474618.1 hypothetical protein [Aquirufa ecclesiirivi]